MRTWIPGVLGRSLLALALAAPCALSMGPASAQTLNVRSESFRGEVTFCTGEDVLVVGTLHEVIKVQGDGTTLIHVNGHFTGMGSFGNEFVSNVNEKQANNFPEFTVRSRQRLISRGAAPNQSIFISVSNDGPFIFEVDCHG